MPKRCACIFISLICLTVFTSTVSFAVSAQVTLDSQSRQAAGNDVRSADTDQDKAMEAASYVPAPEISAASAILVEAKTGQILYSKDNRAASHISSACKLMTVLVAVENSDLSSNVTVSADTVVAEGSALNLEVGAKYALDDLLYAIMLTSANDAAIAVAEHVSAGDIGKFVGMMNATAAKLNMTDTHFTNPTGLLEDYQYTTAYDISLLIRYAVNNPTFNRIFSTKVRPWYGTGDETKILTSSNDLFWSYDYIEGGKTGYNKKEQQSIISTASDADSDMRLICVVLDAAEATMYTDATALFDYGFHNFKKSTLVRKGEIIKTETLDGNEINLVSQSDITYVHPVGDDYISEFNVTSNMKAPLKKAIPVGSANYILDDGTNISISLYPETELAPPPDDFRTATRKTILENKDIFLLVLFLAVIEAILILFNIGKLIRKLFLLILKPSGKRRRSS
ncbi:MAG: D-alanyl-D-alanine carboxypeptidase family protein [Clostridiaceae bacterium]